MSTDPPTEGERLDAEMVIPLRWATEPHPGAVAEMARYLATVAQFLDVTVVDGSPPERFAQHALAWSPHARLVPPDPRPGANGKVVGAMTGVRCARHEWVVLADDDVRYDGHLLRSLLALTDRADLVRPANVFSTWPWHARWDGSRSLLNRALAADWPGTFAVRASVLEATDGWDADVMFENLELVRTVRAYGGVVLDAPHVLVPRLPPTARHFWSQRVRQAYDDLAQPWRLVGALATGPALAWALRRFPAAAAAGALGSIALAEVGRRRHGADRLVPASVPLFAPLWLAERAVCSWLALYAWLRGGVRYRDRRLPTAAHTTAQIRRRLRPGAPHVV